MTICRHKWSRYLRGWMVCWRCGEKREAKS